MVARFWFSWVGFWKCFFTLTHQRMLCMGSGDQFNFYLYFFTSHQRKCLKTTISWQHTAWKCRFFWTCLVHPSSSKWRLLGRPELNRITAYVLLTIQWNCTLYLLEKSARVVFSEKRRGLCAATLCPLVEQLIYFHQQRPDMTEKRPPKVFRLPNHLDLHLHTLK